MALGLRCCVCVVEWAEGERLSTARAPYGIEQRAFRKEMRNVGLDVSINLQAATIRAALSED
jgi:hypothetical protein